jgi:hypothetical protein
MKFPDGITIFGDTKFRGECPTETMEQITFIARIRRWYPHTYGAVATHQRNEGVRHHREVAMHKAEGMVTGAADIIIPGKQTFVCELKRRDHTKSKITDEQIKYLLAAQELGAFCCIALGVEAADTAFKRYIDGTARL